MPPAVERRGAQAAEQADDATAPKAVARHPVPAGRERPSHLARWSTAPRSQARPGMSFGHDVLLALIMAVAMAATVFLYR